MRKQKLDKSDPITEEDGVKIKVKVVKNRFSKGNPYKVCEYLASYTDGITTLFELPNLLEEYGIMEKRGSWYNWKDENGELKIIDGVEAKWRSRTDLVEFLKTNDDYRKYFEDLIASKHEGINLNSIEIKEIENKEKAIASELANIEKNMNITDEEVAVTTSKKKEVNDGQMTIV